MWINLNYFKNYEDKLVEDAKLAKLDVDSKKKEIKKPTNFYSYSFEDDPGSNNSGLYELKVIIF